MPEAMVTLGEGKRIVGRLRFESDGRRQHLNMQQWMKRYYWLETL